MSMYKQNIDKLCETNTQLKEVLRKESISNTQNNIKIREKLFELEKKYETKDYCNGKHDGTVQNLLQINHIQYRNYQKVFIQNGLIESDMLDLRSQVHQLKSECQVLDLTVKNQSAEIAELKQTAKIQSAEIIRLNQVVDMQSSQIADLMQTVQTLYSITITNNQKILSLETTNKKLILQVDEQRKNNEKLNQESIRMYNLYSNTKQELDDLKHSSQKLKNTKI